MSPGTVVVVGACGTYVDGAVGSGFGTRGVVAVGALVGSAVAVGILVGVATAT